MFSTVITAAVLYIATAVDLLVILLVFFARANTRKEYRDIYIGQYLGSVILILVSLFLAFVLHYVPEKWVLGLLGLIPIYLGIKVAIYDDCEGEKRAKKELDEKGLSKLVGIVALVTVASCGADNIGLFVPYFVTLDLVDLLVTLLVFLILIFVLVYTAQRLANISGVGEIVEKFSRWIMAVIYIGLGLFIIIKDVKNKKLTLTNAENRETFLSITTLKKLHQKLIYNQQQCDDKRERSVKNGDSTYKLTKLPWKLVCSGGTKTCLEIL